MLTANWRTQVFIFMVLLLVSIVVLVALGKLPSTVFTTFMSTAGALLIPSPLFTKEAGATTIQPADVNTGTKTEKVASVQPEKE